VVEHLKPPVSPLMELQPYDTTGELFQGICGGMSRHPLVTNSERGKRSRWNVN
jgi:hypothetical protein